jgi:hypothetical protein
MAKEIWLTPEAIGITLPLQPIERRFSIGGSLTFAEMKGVGCPTRNLHPKHG